MTMATKRMSQTYLPKKKNSSAHFARGCLISAHFAAIYMKSSDEQLYGRREHLATHFPFFSSKYSYMFQDTYFSNLTTWDNREVIIVVRGDIF